MEEKFWKYFDSEIKFAMGDIMGYYGQDYTWFWRPDGELIDKKNGYRESTGPNGEFAFTEHFKLFYRNGSWPEVIEGYREYIGYDLW